MYTDQATIDTGSPASFINKKTADVLLKSGASVKLLSTSELPIDTHYVDYNRRTIKLFGTLMADVFSLGWQTNSAKFLVSENRTRCLLNVDLQSSLGVQTTQTRPTPIDEISSPPTDSARWRYYFMNKFKDIFIRKGRSKNHRVHSVFKDPLVPNQEKGRRVPIHIQDKVGTEIKKLIKEGHIVKLNKCTSDHFVAPVVITIKKYGSIKLAIDAKLMNAQIFKNQYQLPNLLEQLDVAAQIINTDTRGKFGSHLSI